MSSDTTKVAIHAINAFTDLLTQQTKVKLAEMEHAQTIQDKKDASNLAFERRLYANDLNNRIQTASLEHAANLGEIKEKYEKLENLGMIKDDFARKIADTADGTEDGKSILDDLETFTLTDFQTSTQDVENTGNMLNDLSVADTRNRQVITVLDNMLAHADESIDLADRVKIQAQQDFNYLNDDLSTSALVEIFNTEFKDYIVNEDGTLVTDKDGNPAPVWNAKWNAFKNSIPDVNERNKVQSTLNSGMSMLASNSQARFKAGIKDKEDAIKAGDKNVKNMWKSYGDYFAYFLSDLPEVTPETISSFEDANYYYTVPLHDFSGELHYAMSGEFGKYGSMDFVIGLEARVEAALMHLAEKGAEGAFQDPTKPLEKLISERDVQGIIDYLVIPKEGPLATWSGDHEIREGDAARHHPRLASQAYQDFIIDDKDSDIGKRNPAFHSDTERMDAWEDLDLIAGGIDSWTWEDQRSAEEGFIKYADLYTLIQNVKVWKSGFERIKEQFKDNPEGWQMFQRDLGNKWAIDASPMTYDRINEMTENFNNVFEENKTRYGFGSPEDLSTEDIQDFMLGEDSRLTMDQRAFSSTYPGGFGSGDIESLNLDEYTPEVVNKVTARKLNYLQNVLEKSLGNEEAAFELNVFSYIEEDERNSILKKMGLARSDNELQETFLTEIVSYYAKMQENNPEEFKSIMKKAEEEINPIFDDVYSEIMDSIKINK